MDSVAGSGSWLTTVLGSRDSWSSTPLGAELAQVDKKGQYLNTVFGLRYLVIKRQSLEILYRIVYYFENVSNVYTPGQRVNHRSALQAKMKKKLLMFYKYRFKGII